MKTVFSGALASFQIPSGFLAERFGAPLVLALGTALAGIGYCSPASATASSRWWRRCSSAGLGQRAASVGLVAHRASLRGRALAQDARHLQFCRRHRQDDAAGDGLAAVRGAAWRHALILLGSFGVLAAIAIYVRDAAPARGVRAAAKSGARRA